MEAWSKVMAVGIKRDTGRYWTILEVGLIGLGNWLKVKDGRGRSKDYLGFCWRNLVECGVFTDTGALVLKTKCFPPKFICGISSQCGNKRGCGLKEVIWSWKWNLQAWEKYPYKKDPYKKGSFLTPSTCEDTVRKQLSMQQEAGSHQTPHLLVPWFWVSSLQN